MGPSRDRTRDPWICSQTRICNQTRYRLPYAARLSVAFDMISKNVSQNFAHIILKSQYVWLSVYLYLPLSVTIHIISSFACCLINVVYLTACAFIRSWWCCTFWMMSPMMLNRHKKSIIMSNSLVQLGKLINRILGTRLLISSLPGSALRTHVDSLG